MNLSVSYIAVEETWHQCIEVCRHSFMNSSHSISVRSSSGLATFVAILGSLSSCITQFQLSFGFLTEEFIVESVTASRPHPAAVVRPNHDSSTTVLDSCYDTLTWRVWFSLNVALCIMPWHHHFGLISKKKGHYSRTAVLCWDPQSSVYCKCILKNNLPIKPLLFGLDQVIVHHPLITL